MGGGIGRTINIRRVRKVVTISPPSPKQGDYTSSSQIKELLLIKEESSAMKRVQLIANRDTATSRQILAPYTKLREGVNNNNIMSKYKLTKNTKECCGKTLFQIEATSSFGSVVKGELGGYIEKEENLSQSGNAWVYGDAWVYGNAWVYGDAQVYGNAWVFGNARVFGNAWVFGNARVFGNAWVYGNAQVYGKLRLTLGYFFGYKEKIEELKFFSLGDDSDYELIGKGDCKVDEDDGKKSELLKKADELIAKANEIRAEAEKM